MTIHPVKEMLGNSVCFIPAKPRRPTMSTTQRLPIFIPKKIPRHGEILTYFKGYRIDTYPGRHGFFVISMRKKEVVQWCRTLQDCVEFIERESMEPAGRTFNIYTG